MLENRKIILTDDNNVDKLIAGLGAKILEYSGGDRVIEHLQMHEPTYARSRSQDRHERGLSLSRALGLSCWA